MNTTIIFANMSLLMMGGDFVMKDDSISRLAAVDIKNAYFDGYDNGYNAGFEAGQRDVILENTHF